MIWTTKLPAEKIGLRFILCQCLYHSLHVWVWVHEYWACGIWNILLTEVNDKVIIQCIVYKTLKYLISIMINFITIFNSNVKFYVHCINSISMQMYDIHFLSRLLLAIIIIIISRHGPVPSIYIVGCLQCRGCLSAPMLKCPYCCFINMNSKCSKYGCVLPGTSPANSATLIYVTQSPAGDALSINGNIGNAGDTGFPGYVESSLK